jgi:hypothetical protein
MQTEIQQGGRGILSMNYRQIKAIEQKNKQLILKNNPYVPERSGIYFLTREENGFKYAYIGQAKHLLTRLAQHLSGYQHIDLSLKKHGFFSKENPCGWNVMFVEYPLSELNAKEQEYIKNYADRGYQLRNKTSGSQGVGKQGLDVQKSPKGYRDGLAQGYKNAQKFVANLFEKHLNYSKKSEKSNKNQEKALEKFKEFLDWSEDNGGC